MDILRHILCAVLIFLLFLVPAMADSRDDFVGLWWVSHGDGAPLQLRLYSDGTAWSDYPANNPGAWSVVDGRAICIWADDWKEVMFSWGTGFVKHGYKPGQQVNQAPSNVSKAFRASKSPDGWYGVAAP